MEDEVGGFVVGVVAAVAEAEVGLVEAAGAKAQEVARGAEVLAGLGKHGTGVFMKW